MSKFAEKMQLLLIFSILLIGVGRLGAAPHAPTKPDPDIQYEAVEDDLNPSKVSPEHNNGGALADLIAEHDLERDGSHVYPHEMPHPESHLGPHHHHHQNMPHPEPHLGSNFDSHFGPHPGPHGPEPHLELHSGPHPGPHGPEPHLELHSGPYPGPHGPVPHPEPYPQLQPHHHHLPQVSHHHDRHPVLNIEPYRRGHAIATSMHHQREPLVLHSKTIHVEPVVELRNSGPLPHELSHGAHAEPHHVDHHHQPHSYIDEKHLEHQLGPHFEQQLHHKLRQHLEIPLEHHAAPEPHAKIHGSHHAPIVPIEHHGGHYAPAHGFVADHAGVEHHSGEPKLLPHPAPPHPHAEPIPIDQHQSHGPIAVPMVPQINPVYQHQHAQHQIIPEHHNPHDSLPRHHNVHHDEMYPLSGHPDLHDDFYAHRMPGDGFGPGGHFAPMPRQEVRHVPIPVPKMVPHPVPVDKPYAVHVDKPYLVPIDRPIAKPYISKVITPVIHKQTIVKSHISHIEHVPSAHAQQSYGALDYNVKN